MRNMLLIAKREYLERLRSKSFVIMTVLVPVLMSALTIGPSLLVTKMLTQGAKHYVVVVSRQSVGEAIQQQLAKTQERESERATAAREKSMQRGEAAPPSQVTTEIDSNASPEERAALTERVRRKELDGVILATDDALAARKLTYITRDVSSFIQTAILEQS